MGSIGKILQPPAVGLAFGAFALGSAWLRFAVMPLVRRRGGDERDVAMRSQDVVRKGFLLFLGLLRRGCLVDYDPRRQPPEVPDGPFVIVANHPTLIDVIAVTATFGRSVCVTKGSLFRSRAIGPILRQCAYVDAGDQGPAALAHCLDAAVDRVREGFPLLVFAEGTRSPPGRMLPFGRLAFEVAARTAVPLVPVHIEADPPFLTKGRPWYRMPGRTVRYRITPLAPLRVGSSRRGAREAMATVERLLASRPGSPTGEPGRAQRPRPESLP